MTDRPDGPGPDDRDLGRVLADWMAHEGTGRAPTRLFETVHARTARGRQVRRWPWQGGTGPSGGLPRAASLSAVAIAASILIATVGIAIMRQGPARQPGAAAPSPASPAAATSTPTATPAASASGANLVLLPTPDPQGTQLVRERICADPITLSAVPAASPPALWAGCMDGARWISLPDAQVVSLPIAGTSVAAADATSAWALSGAGIQEVRAPGDIAGPTIPIPRATALAVGLGSVWVTTGDGDLLRVDPAARRVVGRIRVGPRPVGVVVAGGSVWVIERGAAAVVRVDPAEGKVVASIPAGNDPALITAGGGAVWAASEADGVITRIDTRTGQALRVPQPGRVDPFALSGLGASDEAVYVGERGTLYRLDPATGATIAAVDVPEYLDAIAVVGEDPWLLVSGSLADPGGFLVKVRAP